MSQDPGSQDSAESAGEVLDTSSEPAPHVAVPRVATEPPRQPGAGAARGRRLRHLAPAFGAVVVLAGLGIGLWLGTGTGGPSRSSPSSKDVRTARQFLSDGVRAQLAGQEAMAANDYLRAVALDPKNQDTWYDLGVLEQKAGDRATAEHDYEEAVSADPRDVPALYNLGTIVAPSYHASGAKIYEKVLALDPHDAEAHLNLGFVLEALGKRAEGEAQIADALRLDPALSPAPPTPAA